jgi:hypothetical protein
MARTRATTRPVVPPSLQWSILPLHLLPETEGKATFPVWSPGQVLNVEHRQQQRVVRLRRCFLPPPPGVVHEQLARFWTARYDQCATRSLSSASSSLTSPFAGLVAPALFLPLALLRPFQSCPPTTHGMAVSHRHAAPPPVVGPPVTPPSTSPPPFPTPHFLPLLLFELRRAFEPVWTW